MFFIYRFFINLILILSPVIFVFRYLNKKETLESYKQKIGFFKKVKPKKNLVWFHGASVGEFQSIVPVIEKLEKNKKINRILITSNTLSSLNLIKKYKFKKVIHAFFPIDTNFITKKFIKYWNPSKVFFIDSEIWPNMLRNLKISKIPILLINARITNKTFRRWSKIIFFAKKIFSYFDLCLSSNKETMSYLKKLGSKKIKYIGNLKFSQSEKQTFKMKKKLKKFFYNKRVWCASSTHFPEEIMCAKSHLILKKKFENLVTVIIPRHVEKSLFIKKKLESLNLKVHLDESNQKLTGDIDIYLVNSYGKTRVFFKSFKNIFLGGSLINHGGQNPLEAVRYGCKIINGPHIQNFKEIYKFLEKKNISKKIIDQKDMTKKLSIMLENSRKLTNINYELKTAGSNILRKTISEMNF